MKNLYISDTSIFKTHKSFDFFYAEPELGQGLCRTIFTKVFDKQLDFFSFSGLFYTSINRYFLADMKVLEHPLILQNIILYCSKNNCKEVNFKIHANNKELYAYYCLGLNNTGITSTLEFHYEERYWENSLTYEKILVRALNNLKLIVTVLTQFLFISLNYLIPRKSIIAKKLVFWHSFANNKEKIDFQFLDALESTEHYVVIHPNPYLLISKSNWNKSIYFLKNYTISPRRYFNSVIEFVNFRNKFNLELAEFSDLLPYLPQKWNSTTTTKTFLFMLYNLLENGLLENIAMKDKTESVNVFRGGAAAGLIYSGICKKKFGNSAMKNILVPHGTEFNVIDHFSYFFLDFNILPSELISLNWKNQLEEKFKKYLSYNNCELIAGGRIDYELLNTNVQKHLLEEDIIYIGIVLTYNSETYEEKYICDIKNIFEKVFTKDRCVFIIKPRPNRIFKPGIYMDDNVVIFENDIYSFLNSIDVIIGTVSIYGILTMVVTDGIYCNIPGLYYIPNSKFSSTNLGYSYHDSMNFYTFNSEISLNEYLNNNISIHSFLTSLWKRNKDTKEYLTFDQNANSFLKDFIFKQLI